jgi:transcriptional regulator with XRE-family HTH domain
MINFNKDQIEYFLSVVRKYMSLRGGLSQKDLAERIQVGISTLSRFLNQKTKDIDEQIVARIVADLSIPLHEIIEFVAETDTDTFKKLVSFFKEQIQKQGQTPSPLFPDDPSQPVNHDHNNHSQVGDRAGIFAKQDNQRSTVFHEVQDPRLRQLEEFRDRIQKLSPRQRAYMTDFLELEPEGQEMVVEVGEVVIRYFKSKKMNF